MEEELKRLQQQGIISPVTHSDWATPIVPISKPDRSVRICGDYKVTVNPAAKIDSYPLPKIDDLFTKIAGAKIFSKLDLAHAYQQLELTEDAKRLTTIDTPIMGYSNITAYLLAFPVPLLYSSALQMWQSIWTTF